MKLIERNGVSYYTSLVVPEYAYAECVTKFEMSRMEIPFHDLTGKEVSVKKSLMKAKVNERCCVIGTLFKKMELKPSILKEISNSVRAQIYLHTPSLSLSLASFIHPPLTFLLL